MAAHGAELERSSDAEHVVPMGDDPFLGEFVDFQRGAGWFGAAGEPLEALIGQVSEAW